MYNNMYNYGIYQPQQVYYPNQNYYGGYPQGYPPQMPQFGGYGMNMYQPQQQVFNPYNPMPTQLPNQQQQPNFKEVHDGVFDTVNRVKYTYDGKVVHMGDDIIQDIAIPGVNRALEVTDRYGNTTIIPPTGLNQNYNQGGTTVSQGGFNPITGTMTPPAGTQGFTNNPYNPYRSIGGYGYSGQIGGGVPYENMRKGVPTLTRESRLGKPFEPYDPDKQPTVPTPNPTYNQGYSNYGVFGMPGVNIMNRSPYQAPYYPGYMYGQNQFDYFTQEILYNEQPTAVDAREMLASIILTDEEREKIGNRRNNALLGTDYYGRPIYSNLNYSNQKQKEFEDARRRYQEHFTMLSRIAHAYSGEEINEAEAMRRFDPVPQPAVQQKSFNYYTATPEERKEFEREKRVYDVKNLEYKLQYMEQQKAYFEMQRNYMFAQIKASHDRLIGVEPGQSYDLKTYLDSGYKIGINIAMQQARSAARNGTRKYSRNGYRGEMSYNVNSPIPINSKDDDYVSIEQMLKNMYDRNRNDAIMKQNGVCTNTIIPEDTFSSEREAHQFFLSYMQQQKVKDEVRRAIQ